MDKFVTIKRPAPSLHPDRRSSSSSCSSSSEYIESQKRSKKSQKKSKKSQRNFRSIWIEKFSWLRNKNGSAFCAACENKLPNRLHYLQKHHSLPNHLQNIDKKKNQMTMESFANQEESLLSQQIKCAELTLVMFLICHNLPFLLMDYLPALLKECCPDSKIAASLQCGRTRATELAGVLGNKAKENIVCKLKTQKFSVIVDETTDLSTKKCLVIVVRYFDKLLQRVRDSFLTLIGLTDCDASSIYTSITNFFSTENIPIKNVIGLATDGANVMAGEFNGLKAKFNSDTDIFYVKCSCHSLHLCSAYACKKLPHKIEKLCRNIFSFFAHSPKRIGELKEFQDYCNVQTHKILGVSLTRWLSLEQVINRMLEQWNPLYLFFLNKTLEVDGIKASQLASKMIKPDVKAYFLFLSYILKIINDLNKDFQSETVRLPFLYINMESTVKLIVSNFMRHDFVKNLDSLENINYYDEKNRLPVEKIFIGGKTESYLRDSKMSPSEKLEIKQNILDFYLELLAQIHTRFDFSKKDLQILSIITPSKVLSDTEIEIEPLLKCFSNLVEGDIDDIITQWRKLRLSKLDLKIDMDIQEFWIKVAGMKNGIGEYSFNELSKFVWNLLALPHSSAAAERQFSNLALMKTKLRNKLSIKTLNSMMLSKELNEKKVPQTVWSAKRQFN